VARREGGRVKGEKCKAKAKHSHEILDSTSGSTELTLCLQSTTLRTLETYGTYHIS